MLLLVMSKVTKHKLGFKQTSLTVVIFSYANLFLFLQENWEVNSKMNFYLFCQYYTRFIAILLYFIAILLLKVVFFKLCSILFRFAQPNRKHFYYK